MRIDPWWKAKGSLLAVILAALLVLAPSAAAFSPRTAERVVIGLGETLDDDLYAVAQGVVIDGTVRGDVVTVAQTVIVNGTIEGNLIAAAQTVIITGNVRDSARLAAQAVQLDGRARVGRDLIFLGYSLEVGSNSAVGRDVVLGGYQALLVGPVARNVSGAVSGLELRGYVGGDVDVSVGDGSGTAPIPTSPPPAVGIPLIRPGLYVADRAEIGGHLSYTSNREFSVPDAQVQSGVTWTPRPVQAAPQADSRSMVLDNLRRLATLAIVGLLLCAVAWPWLRRLEELVLHRPLPSLGWGAIAWIAVGATGFSIAAGTILLAATFGLASLSSLVALVIATALLSEAALIIGQLAFAGLLAPAVMSYATGTWLLQRVRPRAAAHRVWPLVVGLPIFVVLSAIPILGVVVALLTAVAILGAAWLSIRDRSTTPVQALAPAGGPSGPSGGLVT